MPAPILTDVDYVPSCALLAKREAMELTGGFAEDLFFYYEDTDWCLRAHAAGFRVVAVRDSHIWHKESRALGGPSSPGKIYYMTRNRFLFASRCFGQRQASAIKRRAILNELRTIALHSILPRYRHLRPQRNARVKALIDVCRGRYGRGW